MATASPPTENPNPNPNPNPDPNPSSAPMATAPNPNPSPVAAVPTPPPPLSFRPAIPPPMQYQPYPNPYYAAPQPGGGIQPPGVVAVAPPRPGVFAVPGQPMYGNGYYQPQPGMPMPMPQGIARYPSPYPMFRPGFPPRPMPGIPQIQRPPIIGVRPITPIVRPPISIVAPIEKPQTTVYVGKIAPSVDNEFLLSLLRLCGPVKSWKRAQDPSDGTPKGFGFCEFETAEGILRAMRLMSKLNIDGQELVLNINQATREYLERYVEKKKESEKLKEPEGQVPEGAPGVQVQEPKLAVEETKDGDDSEDKQSQEKTRSFGIVSDEDTNVDRDVSEKIESMIEERQKTKPLPPPPPPPQTLLNGSVKSVSEVASRSKDGDSDVDIMRSDATEDKIDDETMSDMTVTRSPNKARVRDRSSRERGKEHDPKRDKEQELERLEREQERERVRRERQREKELRDAERFYRDRVKEWEGREREKEHQRQREKEKEKEQQKERRRGILKDEKADDDDDDDTRKRRHRSSMYEEKRRKRQREKEEDLLDRLREDEDIAEARRRAIEEEVSKNVSKLLSSQMTNESVEPMEEDTKPYVPVNEDAPEYVHPVISGSGTGTGNFGNENEESDLQSAEVSESKQSINAPTRKLGFGLVGSGKRTAVPSVFHQEDDEGVDDKKMRPLVPIDYSTEELQAVQPSVSIPSPNLAAAAEFAKRISNVNPKEDRREAERDRSRRSTDRTSHRERDRDDENSRPRNETKEKHDRVFGRERERADKPRAETKKPDAKQLIDMIPKTKEELFGYEINWATYDEYELHDRMKPWISKKITEFLGEEEPTLVEYIVSNTKEHVQASTMLELLQNLLDDEAEMFVLKMWRMLIFEIKKVEAGLTAKARG